MSSLTAKTLVEALPYIKRWSSKRIVVKYGGNALASSDSFVHDIALMHFVGIKPVVVHGAGPQITELMKRLNVESRFSGGYRVTDQQDLDVVRMALQKANKELVSLVNNHGALAVGLSGEDANMLVARPMHNGDLGFVGEVESVSTAAIDAVVAGGFVPIIAPMGCDAKGQAHNINADHAAAAIAEALGAVKLVILTDVRGILRDPDDPDSLVEKISTSELKDLVAQGVVNGGMVPKVESCIAAVRNGVRSAHIVDGRRDHALLEELFTDSGVGTMVVP